MPTQANGSTQAPSTGTQQMFIQVTVRGDDWDAVRERGSRNKELRNRLHNAIFAEPTILAEPMPPKQKLTPKQLASYRDSNDNAFETITKDMESAQVRATARANCRMAIAQMAHVNMVGIPKDVHDAAFAKKSRKMKLDMHLKCSLRAEELIEIVGKDKRMALEVMRGKKLDQMAYSPKEYLNLKFVSTKSRVNRRPKVAVAGPTAGMPSGGQATATSFASDNEDSTFEGDEDTSVQDDPAETSTSFEELAPGADYSAVASPRAQSQPLIPTYPTPSSGDSQSEGEWNGHDDSASTFTPTNIAHQQITPGRFGSSQQLVDPTDLDTPQYTFTSSHPHLDGSNHNTAGPSNQTPPAQQLGMRDFEYIPTDAEIETLARGFGGADQVEESEQANASYVADGGNGGDDGIDHDFFERFFKGDTY